MGYLNIVSFVVTNLLEYVLSSDRLENILLRRLLNLAADQQLVEDEICFLKVKDDVKFTDLKVV